MPSSAATGTYRSRALSPLNRIDLSPIERKAGYRANDASGLSGAGTAMAPTIAPSSSTATTVSPTVSLSSETHLASPGGKAIEALLTTADRTSFY